MDNTRIVEPKRYKYPRTFHLPWSLGATQDDKKLISCSQFVGKSVVVTEKMDGENTSLYQDYFHARSIDSGYHSSRNYVKGLWANIRYSIPIGWRICGENLYAKHSLYYENLDSYFEAFSVWNAANECLDWNIFIEFCSRLGIAHVPILYVGLWNEEKIKSLMNESDLLSKEGYVVRLESSFRYEDFGQSVAKFVRKNHVSTTENWKHNWSRNKLKGK